MSAYETETGLEFGETGTFGEFGETGEYGEFAGEFGEAAGIGEFGEFGAGEFGETEQFLGGILGSVLGGELESPLNEAQEIELASELLEISSEEELEQFLGNIFKGVAKGVGGFIKSPIGRALGGVLKSVAKKALPVVGGALGSMVAPGLGTALGSKLGSMASGLFEVELEAMPQEQAEFEVARRVVNLAASSARNAALARPQPGISPQTVAQAAIARAARTWAPGLHRRMVPALRASVGRAVARRPGYRRSLPYRMPTAYPAGVYGAPAAFPVDGPQAPPMEEPIYDGGQTGFAMSGRWVRRGRKIVVIGA